MRTKSLHDREWFGKEKFRKKGSEENKRDNMQTVWRRETYKANNRIFWTTVKRVNGNKRDKRNKSSKNKDEQMQTVAKEILATWNYTKKYHTQFKEEIINRRRKEEYELEISIKWKKLYRRFKGDYYQARGSITKKTRCKIQRLRHVFGHSFETPHGRHLDYNLLHE